MRKELIGKFAVDSGQFLICDPCYIDDYWKNEDFEDSRAYQHKVSGEILRYRLDFKHYNDPIPSNNNANMNDLLATGDWIEMEPEPARNNFSYNACCRKTLSPNKGGSLKFDMGHDGIGVAIPTPHGDGYYNVYKVYNSRGEFVRIQIDFL